MTGNADNSMHGHGSTSTIQRCNRWRVGTNKRKHPYVRLGRPLQEAAISSIDLDRSAEAHLSDLLCRHIEQMTDDGKTLIIVNISSGELFTVDPETGTAALIDVGGVSLHGDGLVRIYEEARLSFDDMYLQ